MLIKYRCPSLPVLLFLILISTGLILSGCSSAKTDFEEAKTANSVEAYDSFLEKHAESSYHEEIKSLRESAYFNYLKTEIENKGSQNIFSLSNMIDTYFAEYPNGKHSREMTIFRERIWFQKALKEDTPDSYQQYLLEYPDGSFVERARQAREEALYQQAIKSESDTDFESYLTEYPKGRFASEIKELRENFRFESAKEENTVAALDSFLADYPLGKLSGEANELREEILFKQAIETNSIQEYREYLIQYPVGRFADQAKSALEPLEYENATTVHSVAVYDQYLAKYPESNNREAIIGLREEALFSAAKSLRSLKDYFKYILEYPEGKYIKEAKEFVTDNKFRSDYTLGDPDMKKAWETTLEIDNFFQYYWFIKEFPNSKYVEDAKQLMQKKKEAIDSLKE